MSVDIATLLSALAEIPGRLAALEREQARVTAELAGIRATLPPLLVSVPDAAQALKVSVPTMRRWVKAGAVPTVRVGNTVRVDLSRMGGTDANDIARLASSIRRG
jgi:excisionase family DNA binding protein